MFSSHYVFYELYQIFTLLASFAEVGGDFLARVARPRPCGRDGIEITPNLFIGQREESFFEGTEVQPAPTEAAIENVLFEKSKSVSVTGPGPVGKCEGAHNVPPRALFPMWSHPARLAAGNPKVEIRNPKKGQVSQRQFIARGVTTIDTPDYKVRWAV